MPRLSFFIVALTACSLAATARGQSRDVEKLYASLCASCHGPALAGGSSPSLITGKWKHGGSDDDLARSIADGYPEQGMPAFGKTVSAAERRGLVVFIREKAAAYQRDRSPAPRASAHQIVRTQHLAYRVETVADALSTPWSLAWLPDGRLLVTEKIGRLRIIDAQGRLLPAPVTGLPAVDSGGQGGLLDIALHPDYATNGWIYLAYSDPQKDADGRAVAMTAVIRGRLHDGAWTDQQTIFRAPLATYRPAGGVHFGCRLVFDRQGHLFFSIGDRGSGPHAQDLTRPNGKIHRVLDDGRIPTDNPFRSTPGALPSLWTYGNRNPQGLAFDPRTGFLWETEHGPRGGDELNLLRPGLNYGWPVITYGMNYNGTPMTALTTQDRMEQPVTHWTPSIAVCGINFYTGDAFAPWQGNLLVTALAQQELRRIEISDTRVVSKEIIAKDLGRLRHVIQGPDGLIYLAVNSPDRIVRLVPVPAPAR